MADIKTMRTITLTDRPPVRIEEASWPIVAVGSADEDDSNQPGNAPNREWTRTIRVRQHADGRAIVYGVYNYFTVYQGERGAGARRGIFIGPGGATSIIHAILAVARGLAGAETAAAIEDDRKDPEQWSEVAQGCIANLPAETI
jgi:hypothetical protein